MENMDILKLAFDNPVQFAIGLVLLAVFVLLFLKRTDRTIELEQLKQYTKHHNELLDDNKDLRARVEVLTQSFDTIKDKNLELRTESVAAIALAVKNVREDMQKTIDAITIELANAKNRISHLETDLAQTKKLLEAKSEALMDTQKLLEEMRVEKEKSTNDAAYLRGQVEALKTQIDSLYKLLAGFQQPIAPTSNHKSPQSPAMAQDETVKHSKTPSE